MIRREEDARREAQTALAREQALELVETGNADVEVVGTGNADVALLGTGNADETDASHSIVDPDVEHCAPDVADASKDTSVANHGVGHPGSTAPTPKLATPVRQHSAVVSPANNKRPFAKPTTQLLLSPGAHLGKQNLSRPATIRVLDSQPF